MKKDVIMDITAIEYTDKTKGYELRIEGNTYPHKEEIKALGFCWNHFDSCWEKQVNFTSKENMIEDIKNFMRIEWLHVDRTTRDNALMKLFGNELKK